MDMTPSNDPLAKVLDRFDRCEGKISEAEIADALRALPRDEKAPWASSLTAEFIAYSFHEREPDSDASEYRWFAPLGSGRNEDGTGWEFPSRRQVDREMIDYWTERARQSRNPVLRARYAGLVWEFGLKACGERPGIETARTRIDAVIEMAGHGRHKRDAEVLRKLGQVLDLAIRINDRPRIEQVRDTVIAYETRVGGDDANRGLWGSAFDLLYANKKARLTPEQLGTLVNDLESRLDRLVGTPSTEGALDLYGVGEAAGRLATHYRMINQPEDVRRVLLKVEQAYTHRQKGLPSLVAQSWCNRIEQLYRRFGLTDDAARLRITLRELGPATQDALSSFEHSVRVPKGKMDAYVNAILAGGLDAARHRFAGHYVLRRSQAVDELRDLAEKAVMPFLIQRVVLDDRGRPVANIGPLEEDLDGHVAAHTSQNIALGSMFLRRVIHEMTSRYAVNAEVVLGWIKEAPVFAPSRFEILRRGLASFFDGDALVSLHLLVPQVENALRELVELAGGDVYKPNRHGGMDLRTMDDLLRDPVLVDVLSADVAEYLRILFTDRRGINLRNDLCHGMVAAEAFGQVHADRVFHAIVLLSEIRRRDTSGPDAAAA